MFLVRTSSLALFLCLVIVGCSGGAGSGKLVKLPGKGEDPGVGSDTRTTGPTDGTLPDTNVSETTPKGPTAIQVSYKEGRRETYSLVNDITVYTQGEGAGEVLKHKSFLNADQIVHVHKREGDGGLVTIQTLNVRSGVEGKAFDQKQADAFIKKTAEGIEGSTLQGVFDKTGRGSQLELLGEGVGLNPMGPQAGSQTLMTGFMGMVFPNKQVKIGERWTATYDISQSGADLFEESGARVVDGEVPLTYELVDYDQAKNFVQIKITGKGKPTIKIPMSGAMVEIKMDVNVAGQALVRYDDGWLQELRLESTIVTEGFVATKQVVKTVTRRMK